MKNKKYLELVRHYESCFERHGDTHKGVDWSEKEDACLRYQIMLDVVRKEDRDNKVSLLDFGCGVSHLYEYILEEYFTDIQQIKMGRNDC